uniref:Mitogen-activated protein kinase binding protein 1 n=1 Tax=Hippocampus comes TaxID=109280 RepID=A0A3Q2Y182_HIPCM
MVLISMFRQTLTDVAFCLACDPKTGLVAYPAGCVVVLLNPRKNRQQHLINTSRKTITALSFSQDGKYLVTGESGHLPAVRLWDVSERRQVSELQKHEYGVSCVAFSPDGKHIVSVGNQHDMMVNVWAWKKDVVIAANKVSSKVTGVSFSEDSSYFVTVGNRHVKFWYLDHCKASKVLLASTPMPLLGRSGLLGELRNNFFCDVACGRGQKSESTFCVTFSGLLCEFNGNRMLDKWVDLQTSVAQSLSLSWDRIFCSCADGTVRVFSPLDLRFVCTLPRPHPLGADVASVTQASHLLCSQMDARYPDATAVTYDPISRWLSCVYADHSVFVWDVTDLTRVAKVHSALFHAACVWDLEMFPDIPGEMVASVRPVCAFLSCSSDSTIRLWHVDERTHVHSRNILSTDLLKIIYTGTSTAALQEAENLTNTDGQPVESRVGVRTICVSPDGKHLASGDRDGILRIHNLSSMEEILKVEAHDAEILCLEYSKPQTGLQLLATASRDRLIHVLDATSDYSLVQTLDEHSSSITAVRFAATDGKVRLISCGADKSIYFRTAHTVGTEFRCSHHTVRKTTLYDMGVEPSCKHVAVGCQDVLIFNISNGKQKKLYRGSLCDDGSLLRVQIDPSGQYVAASCSNKNISIFDFRTGECVATMFGHSEIVTGLRFTNDCKHLISVSGDSCIFVWRLAPELTISMQQKLFQLRQPLKSPPPYCFQPDLATPVASRRPRRRWSHRRGSLELKVKSMLELRQLETFTPSNHADTEACSSTPVLHDSVLSSDRPDKKNLRQPIVGCDWLSPEGAESSEMIWVVREDDEDDAALQDRYNHVCTQSHNAAKSSIQHIDTHKSIRFTGSVRYSADNASLSPGSSEDEQEEGAKAKAAIVDEAGQEDFLRQNFETLADACNPGRMILIRVLRLSISSRFLARGDHSRYVAPLQGGTGRVFLLTYFCLHQVLHSSPDCGEEVCQEMVKVLSGALTSTKAELDLLPSSWPPNSAPWGSEVKGEGDKALALLEQYAELLLKSVERKLESKM